MNQKIFIKLVMLIFLFVPGTSLLFPQEKEITNFEELNSGKIPQFTSYNGKGHQFNYPKGWYINIIPNGYTISEKDPNSAISPGIIFILNIAVPNIEKYSSKTLSKLIVAALKPSFQSLKVISAHQHPKYSAILRQQVEFVQQNVSYLAISFTLADYKENRLIFLLFYSPKEEVDRYNFEGIMLKILKSTRFTSIDNKNIISKLAKLLE